MGVLRSACPHHSKHTDRQITAGKMPCAAEGGPCTGIVNIHWPLYTVLPICTVLFYATYLGSHRINSRSSQHTAGLQLNQRIWRQNLCATVHTYVLVLLLSIVVLKSQGDLQAALLLPYYDPLAYCAICLSLAYMLLTLPWSMRHWFGTKRERQATNQRSSSTTCLWWSQRRVSDYADLAVARRALFRPL